LNSPKKQVSHIANLHCYIYEGKDFISRTSLTTKEKSKTVASNSMSASISNYNEKNVMRRKILEKKGKKKIST
jgi:hypothetical protein